MGRGVSEISLPAQWARRGKNLLVITRSRTAFRAILCRHYTELPVHRHADTDVAVPKLPPDVSPDQSLRHCMLQQIPNEQIPPHVLSVSGEAQGIRFAATLASG